jgi:GTP-binding protein EngB required for normal cell division
LWGDSSWLSRVTVLLVLAQNSKSSGETQLCNCKAAMGDLWGFRDVCQG